MKWSRKWAPVGQKINEGCKGNEDKEVIFNTGLKMGMVFLYWALQRPHRKS
jgi:hypothetical protein